ncbi:fatty acyl-CoA reductase [Scenedesmus sp. PABB004]|nr:fatty acyl-CoA reductase [Scenedesmus sp. PABB004]
MSPLGSWGRAAPGCAAPHHHAGAGGGSYSIRRAFDGATVFITGASGYIGSVVLEQLLRTTGVATVYLLLRPRRGEAIQARADKLLQGALFHKVPPAPRCRLHRTRRGRRAAPAAGRCAPLTRPRGARAAQVRDSPKLLSKVRVMGGDISAPGLGLSAADRSTLLGCVDFIIHCAADIRLEADIQETLTANFEGTRTVLELAAAAGHLKALVHVSSAFVNMNQPRSSIIDEQVYPLRYGNQVADVEELARVRAPPAVLCLRGLQARARARGVPTSRHAPPPPPPAAGRAQELLSMPSRDANRRAAALLERWAFPNTYTMGKHMSEQLVTRYQARLQLPVAIVRPSLVCALAGEPYPGYVGNWAGPIGAGAAMAIGLFDCLQSVASQPMGVWDVVPADLVASSIIASAAAVAAGVGAAISRVTRSGGIVGSASDAAVVLGTPHQFSPAAAAARLAQGEAAAAAARAGGRAFAGHDVAATIKVADELAGGAGGDAAGAKPGPGKPPAAGRARSDDTAMPPGGRHGSLADLAGMAPASDGASDACSTPSAGGSPQLRAGRGGGGRGVALTASLLERVGRGGGGSEECMHSIDELALSEATAGEETGGLPLLIVHAATSSTYPLTLMEGWNYNLDFFDAHPQPFRITLGALPPMPPSFVPSEAAVLACRRRIWWKVWAIAGLLRLAGREREAKKLVVGYEAFCVHNNSKTDRDLVFSTHALVALEAALAPDESPAYLLVWRPMQRPGASAGAGAGAGAAKAGGAAAKPGGGRKAGKGGAAKAAGAGAGAPLAGRAEAALAPVGGDVTWRRYVHTQMAGIYRLLYGVAVDPAKPMASALAAAAAGGGELRPEAFIEHDFVRIKPSATRVSSRVQRCVARLGEEQSGRALGHAPGRVARRRAGAARSTLFPDPIPSDVKLEVDQDPGAKEVTYDEEAKAVRIPLAAVNDGSRRTKLVMFTCNKCGGRTARLVNPVAWEKGAVFCQCQHCGVWHTLAAHPSIIEEVRYNDPGWSLERQGKDATAAAAAAAAAASAAPAAAAADSGASSGTALGASSGSDDGGQEASSAPPAGS